MNLGFIILILFLLIIIFSLILAKDKSNKITINSKSIKTYWRRVPYCFIAIMILVCVTIWLFILPILGILFLIK